MTHYEVYGDRDERVSDVEWLEYCAAHQLVVLSKDRRLRYRPDEIDVIRRLGIRAFVLSRGNLTGEVQAQRFLDNADEIERHLSARGPLCLRRTRIRCEASLPVSGALSADLAYEPLRRRR